MCGIAGAIDFDRVTSTDALLAVARLMAEPLTHRGPDDTGSWADPENGVALGHRRLAVLDLTPSGHQPMTSADDRFVLDYNGELYNAHQLAAELAAAGHHFRGRSDTEVLLESIARWGIRGALERTNGMFAFAVWDKRERRLTLARDRIGEKPLYYGWFGRWFVFGSELRALTAHPGVNTIVDRRALTLFARFGYVPAPWSILAGVNKMLPGHLLEVSSRRSEPSASEEYWSLPEASDGVGPSSEADAVEELEVRLRTSIGMRLAADVPVGAFLSGGVDSSVIVALMQMEARTTIRTFTVGFEEAGFDESGHARAVAAHLGTDHTDHIVTAREALDLIPTLPAVYDEPFADSSQIPTSILARLARSHVTVALSGDGGDELLSGYDRHALDEVVWRRVGAVPAPLRTALGWALGRAPVTGVDRTAALLMRALPRDWRVTRAGERIRRTATVMQADSAQDAYVRLMSLWQEPARLVLGGSEPPTLLTEPARWPGTGVFGERVARLDTMSYLPDDLLAKVDRATMAVSLESRIPMLDHTLVEWAHALPYRYKVRGGHRKWLLRAVLDRHVPPSLTDRPKMGFGVPIGDWLRGPLRPWAEDLLAPQRLSAEGYFDTELVGQAWREHLRGRRDRQHELWAILTFQSWLDRHGSTMVRG